MKESSLTSSAALAAFSEQFVEGRRALVFGSSLSAVPRLLIERGARIVQVCDPVPSRVEEATTRLAAPGLAFATFADELLQSREGGFDFVLVEHLGAFDARTVVTRAKRLLAARGVALFATPNRECTAPLLPAPEPGAAPLDYYALYDLVASEFEHVRMLGQAPFVGYAVVDFAPEGNPDPVIDSELVPRGSEEPELFVAVASRHRASVMGYTVIQLPMHRVLSRQASTQKAGPPAPVRELRAPAEVDARLARQEAWIRELESRAETADARADAAEERAEEIERELEAARSDTRAGGEAQRALAQANARIAELARKPDERPALAARIAELEALLVEREATLRKRDVAVADRDRAITERDQRITELEISATPDSVDDLARHEEQLVERGVALRRLERELAEAERVGRELVAELERARRPDRATASALSELGARLARSEADRQALSWFSGLPGHGGGQPGPPTG